MLGLSAWRCQLGRRALSGGNLGPAIEAAHAEACAIGLPTYVDPESGYTVITEQMHRQRGTCCGNACRHCPFGHLSVQDPAMRSATVDRPVMILTPASRRAQLRARKRKQPRTRARAGGQARLRCDATAQAADDGSGAAEQVAPRARDVLFWSGGKDSWLALDAITSGGLAAAAADDDRTTAAAPAAAATATAATAAAAAAATGCSDAAAVAPSPLLLTTFDGRSGEIPFQGFRYGVVVAQARALDLDLLLVPLPAHCPNDEYVAAVLGALRLGVEGVEGAAAAEPLPVARLVFGDLHLAEVRRWREAQFAHRLPCAFPLFGVPYGELLGRLWRAQDEGELAVGVSAVEDEAAVGTALAVGSSFDRASVADLARFNASCDVMGEGGEFHTVVSFPSRVSVGAPTR
jgi:ATP-binding cassette subfamily B (MDR/TAP) protein 1